MAMKREMWRVVPGWPYEVSNLGRVRRQERVLGGHTDVGRKHSRHTLRHEGRRMETTSLALMRMAGWKELP